MINYGAGGENRSTWEIMFAWTGSALSTCYLQVLIVIFIGVFCQILTSPDLLGVTMTIAIKGHTMSLFPVSFLLVFRNGMSFNRYFEGRGHCGKFVHACRTLSRLANTHVTGEPMVVDAFREGVARLLKVHAVAQRHSVRGTEDEAISELGGMAIMEPQELVELQNAKKNLPLVVLTLLGQHIARHASDLPAMGYHDYTVHERIFEEMDKYIDDLMEAWMECINWQPHQCPFLSFKCFYL